VHNQTFVLFLCKTFARSTGTMKNMQSLTFGGVKYMFNHCLSNWNLTNTFYISVVNYVIKSMYHLKPFIISSHEELTLYFHFQCYVYVVDLQRRDESTKEDNLFYLLSEQRLLPGRSLLISLIYIPHSITKLHITFIKHPFVTPSEKLLIHLQVQAC